MIRVNVDPTNPGQFFACCGLLELADRLWRGAEGWFEDAGRAFCINTSGDLASLVKAFCKAELHQEDDEDNTGSAIEIRWSSRSLLLNWWHDESFADRKLNGKELKVWAGTMESVRIARAMQHELNAEKFHEPHLFNIGLVARDSEDLSKKVEPYYFDARRAPNAHSQDVGFSPNDLGLTTTAYPAVELFCLVGLQRARPQPTTKPRIFDYFTWQSPLPANLLLAATTGQLEHVQPGGYRFENWYRTSQRKHKAFRSAIPLTTTR